LIVYLVKRGKRGGTVVRIRWERIIGGDEEEKDKK
jgi:hypothetical protein